MAIRVAHIGTGNVGRIALDHLISDPRFELTAAAVGWSAFGLNTVEGFSSRGPVTRGASPPCDSGSTRPRPPRARPTPPSCAGDDDPVKFLDISK